MRPPSIMMDRVYAFSLLCVACLVPAVGTQAATNSELVPGSRIVFPYYDLRPGSGTFLLLTTTGSTPTSVILEFYDTTCARQNAIVRLSAGDVNLVDLRHVVSGNTFGAFQQGFVDATTSGDPLIGTAIVVDVTADWAIAYPGAPARHQATGLTPFEPYPTRLFLPAFLTAGGLGSGVVSDGLLIVAAPHPTVPGGALPAEPIQASLQIVLQEPTTGLGAQPSPDRVRSISSEVRGHHLLLPIGQIAGAALPTLGWLSITNHVTDDSGVPFGLVGLYIQSLIGPGRSRGMAIRLSADPSPP